MAQTEEIIKALVNAKANVDIQEDNSKVYGSELYGGASGETSLHLAIKKNYLDVAKILINAGAKVNKQCRYLRTPIFHAKNKEAFNLLLDSKADVNSQDCWQWTPLHEAVICKNIEIFKELLKCNADTTIINHGRTAFDLIDSNKHSEDFYKIMQEVPHENAIVACLSKENNFVPTAIAMIIHAYAFSYKKKEIPVPVAVEQTRNSSCVVQ